MKSFTCSPDSTPDCHQILAWSQGSLSKVSWGQERLPGHIGYFCTPLSSIKETWGKHTIWTQGNRSISSPVNCKDRDVRVPHPDSRARARDLSCEPFKEWVGGISLSLSLRLSVSPCLISWDNPLRTTLNENYSNSLCLTAKRFPWASAFGLEMSPKQFYTRAVEFVSKKYLFAPTVWNLNGEWEDPAGGCEVWQCLFELDGLKGVSIQGRNSFLCEMSLHPISVWLSHSRS